jgi:Dolichyl-phosphate-mannose-protein mannosyltransferase
VPLQDWIYHLEQGTGAKVIKLAVTVMGFVALAALCDALAYQSFSSEEAMETAQLARNLARGKGYTTQSIRPLSIWLLRKQAPPGQAAGVLDRPIPDLSTPPVYPALVAGLMAVLPFDFIATQDWEFAPERWIAVFNQALFFVAVFLLFRIAQRLFDARVAWLSAVIFAGSNLYWKFTVSGLSTSWLLVVFLLALLCLVHLQERGQAGRRGFGSVVLALCAGILMGIGGLTRYGFSWMIIPVLAYMGWIAPRGRGKLCCAVAAAGFLVIVGPWIARNIAVSGNPYGTAQYAVLQQTPPFPEDTLERSFDPENGFQRVSPLDVVDKIFINAREMWRNDLPRLGGNWASAFFLVGLLIPFRNPALGRMRIFLVGSIILLFVAQAAGQTYISSDSPEINSENLLAILAPLVFVYGVALFYTLLDQLNLVTADVRGAVVGCFISVMCAPLLMSFLVGHRPPPDTPYSPLHIGRVARFMHLEELMISDIPSAVAWYGDRQCGWLTLDDDQEFYRLDRLKPVKAVFLTQRTTNSRFLSQMMVNPKSWGHFVVECEGHGEIPTGFPLTKAPAGLLPAQLLVSDKPRWRMPP